MPVAYIWEVLIQVAAFIPKFAGVGFRKLSSLQRLRQAYVCKVAEWKLSRGTFRPGLMQKANWNSCNGSLNPKS